MTAPSGRLYRVVERLPDFVVVNGRQSVEAWSVRRLPFEPGGSMLMLRETIRSALGEMDAGGAGSLRAVYATESTDFCDAENVLLYNVGPASFTRLAGRRLTFERSSSVPACPVPLSGRALHHQRYSVDDVPSFEYWTVDGVVARGHSSMPRRTAKPADWWWQVRIATRSSATVPSVSGPFGLRVRIHSAAGVLPAMLKPLLDGVIAGLHSDASPSEEAAARVADDLHLEPETVRRHLTSPGPLGERRPLVRPYRTGVQWNPADDLCAACTVERVDSAPHGEVQWELLAVSPLAT